MAMSNNVNYPNPYGYMSQEDWTNSMNTGSTGLPFLNTATLQAIPSVYSINNFTGKTYSPQSSNIGTSFTETKEAGLAKTILGRLEDIEKRLSILIPDPKKLEQFEALQKAYAHYKMLESLCDITENPNGV